MVYRLKEVIYDEEGIKEINGHSIPYTLEQLAESNEKVTENSIKANKDEWKKPMHRHNTYMYIIHVCSTSNEKILKI